MAIQIFNIAIFPYKNWQYVILRLKDRCVWLKKVKKHCCKYPSNQRSLSSKVWLSNYEIFILEGSWIWETTQWEERLCNKTDGDRWSLPISSCRYDKLICSWTVITNWRTTYQWTTCPQHLDQLCSD